MLQGNTVPLIVLALLNLKFYNLCKSFCGFNETLPILEILNARNANYYNKQNGSNYLMGMYVSFNVDFMTKEIILQLSMMKHSDTEHTPPLSAHTPPVVNIQIFFF